MLKCHFERSREGASHETLNQVQGDEQKIIFVK